MIDHYLEIIAIGDQIRSYRGESILKDKLILTLEETRKGVVQIIDTVRTSDFNSSKKRRILEGVRPLMSGLRKSFLIYVMGKELTYKEIEIFQDQTANQKILKILSIAASLSVVEFKEKELANRVLRDFLNVLFNAYDPLFGKRALAEARARLNTFMMEFDNQSLTKANAGQKRFDKSNKEIIEELVSVGYSRDLWTKGIDFETSISEGITEEGKKESIRKASFEMVEIALALGIKEINGQEVSLEKAEEINSYDKAKAFIEGLKKIKVAIPEDRQNRLEEILHYIEAKDAQPIMVNQEESKFRVTIKKDFLNEATAGVGVPGCFDTNGMRRGVPLIHAMEANAGFIQVYNESGKQVANAVIVYGQKGAYIYSGYSFSSYDMDLIFGRALIQLTKYVPQLVLDSTSAGYGYLLRYGDIDAESVTIVKPATIFNDQYFEPGPVDGQLTLLIQNPLIVARESIQAKKGFDMLGQENIDQTQEKLQTPDKKEIDFRVLAKLFIDEGLQKYLFMISFLKKKVREEGKLAIDDGFYKWVNAKIREELNSDEINNRETDYITDLMIDFLEKQEWPIEILTARGDAAMHVRGHRPGPGGIDLTPANMNLQTKMDSEQLRVSVNTTLRGNDKGIQFHLDPAMLARLQNAPGFVPVIINIQPLINLRQFLGVDS